MIKNNETVYDEKISPLMEQIIAVCEQEDIPFLCLFQLGDHHDPEGTLICTSGSIPADADPLLHAVAEFVREEGIATDDPGEREPEPATPTSNHPPRLDPEVF